MIVDMVRNDLGRIGDTGSLMTTALHTVESFSTVHQLTSTVEVQTDAGLFDVFAATFPGASITGAPKVNTAGFIADLERTPRGLYTGTIGAIPPDGDFEFNIAIRTAWVNTNLGRATYGVGGGVVWDSDPTAEWNEAHDKARVLYRADRPFRLLESIAWTPECGSVLLERHLDRLSLAATHFGFDVDLDEVRRTIESFNAGEPQVIRVLVGLGGAVELEPRAMPMPDPNPVVVFDTRPIDRGDEFLRHKTTRRDRYDEARERFPEAYDVLLWNRLGQLCESTIANLVVEIDNEYRTPPIEAGLLPGTMRAELLDRGDIVEAMVTFDEPPGCRSRGRRRQQPRQARWRRHCMPPCRSRANPDGSCQAGHATLRCSTSRAWRDGRCGPEHRSSRTTSDSRRAGCRWPPHRGVRGEPASPPPCQ
ncbi:MAG: hypothetical protein EBY52_02765 [Actinobacteria bacterium]|nr:hypothetical protein [Actinomycetota bacterium]